MDSTSTTGCSLVLLLVLALLSPSLACNCDHFSWSSWSACTKTCNYGTQQRSRAFVYDQFFWKYSCHHFCDQYESRACNEQSCPISCLLTEFGPWSECSPCAKKQLRTRSVLRPSQFGGEACGEVLATDRPCHPDTECRIPEVDCGEDFKCDNGRCINATLTCNSQNDCDDNSDERDCGTLRVVCPRDVPPPPGSDLAAKGFDAMAEVARAPVLQNRFMGGGECLVARPKSIVLYYRVPHNFEQLEIKVGVKADFENAAGQMTTSPLRLSDSSSKRHNKLRHSYRNVFHASRQKDSKLYRVHQVLPVSTFRMRRPSDLVLSGPFLQYLSALPLEYNYPLYRDIFRRFGTHYYSSGSLGGVYEMIYQYDSDTVTSSGSRSEEFSQCIFKENLQFYFFYTKYTSSNRCTNTWMNENFQGSFMSAAKKSYSLVEGGQPAQAARLAWLSGGTSPPRDAYDNWSRSVIQTPVVVDYQLRSIVDLVRGVPCAATKRRHLRQALQSYLEEFDVCKCAPCPNNALAALSGTECRCLCKAGTFGVNCEQSLGNIAGGVDGSWSCWGPWDECGVAMKRQRSRRCDNPAPLGRGQPCQGASREMEPCHISIFEKQTTCDNDDDYRVGWRDELPPGVVGCLRPKRPANSYILKAKQYYEVGEDETFQCFTGFENHGSPFIHCLPDFTWSQPNGRCARTVCAPPVSLPDGLELYPDKKEYQIGESVGLNCREPGLVPAPAGAYRCTPELRWHPEVPKGLHCVDARPFVPEIQCDPGKMRQGSACVCVDRESCLSYQENLCALNLALNVTVPMSTCSLPAARCHGDPFIFANLGPCAAADLDWVRFRARMAAHSAAQEPCGADICYDWETCEASSGGKRCLCRVPTDCPQLPGATFCIELVASKRRKEVSLCLLAALRCSSFQLEVLNEGPCEAA